MADTTFVSGTTITSSWLNDVNGIAYGLPKSSGSSLIGFQQAGTGAGPTDLQTREKLIVYATDFFANGVSGALVDRTGVIDSSAGIQAALNIAVLAGAGVTVKLPQGTYNLGTTTLSIPAKATLQGSGRESSFLNYSGAGTAIDVAGVYQWALRDFRLGLGASATIVALNIRTTAGNNIRWGKVSNIEIAPASIVAGQKGIQFVATGPEIATDCWFEDINIFGVDKPIIRTNTEGNFWSGIDIDTWGATAGAVAIDSVSHAEFMQARVAGIPSGGTGTAYKQTSNDNIDNIVADAGPGNSALNVTGLRNAITLSRTGNTTPLGTVVSGNSVIEGINGSIVQCFSKSAIAIIAPVDTNSNALVTATVNANAMGANGSIRGRAFFTYTNNANSKTLRIKFGGTTILAIARTTQLSSYFDFTISNRGATNSQATIGPSGFHGDNTITTFSTPTTSAIDTTASTTVVLEVQKATAGDTITLESYQFDLVRP